MDFITGSFRELRLSRLSCKDMGLSSGLTLAIDDFLNIWLASARRKWGVDHVCFGDRPLLFPSDLQRIQDILTDHKIYLILNIDWLDNVRLIEAVVTVAVHFPRCLPELLATRSWGKILRLSFWLLWLLLIFIFSIATIACL